MKIKQKYLVLLLLLLIVVLFIQKGGIKMNEEDKKRMRTFLLSSQRKNQQAIQNQTYNPVGCVPQNVKQNITSLVNNPFNYTDIELKFMHKYGYTLADADEDGDLIKKTDDGPWYRVDQR